MSNQRECYLNTSSSEDESGDHESPQPRSKRPREDVSPPRSSSASDGGAPEACRGRGSNRGSRGSSTSRGRKPARPFTEEQELVDFYQHNRCFYDKEDTNFSNPTVKATLLAEIADRLNTEPKLIETWFNTKRRYYTQNVQKSTYVSGSAARPKTPKYEWVSKNFSFLDGLTRPTTQRDQLGSGVRHTIAPSPVLGASGNEDSQDTQDSVRSRGRTAKRMDSAFMEGIASMTQTSERLASSLLAKPHTAVSTQDQEDGLSLYFRSLASRVSTWGAREKRRFIFKCESAFQEMAEEIEDQQPQHHTPAPVQSQQLVVPPQQHAPVNRSWSFGQGPLSQLPEQPDFSQPGTSGYIPPPPRQQPLPVPTNQLGQPGYHPPRQQSQPLSAVTTSYEPPVRQHVYQHSSYVPSWQATSPVHLLPPRSPSPTYHDLETSTENPLSLTRLVRDHLEGMSDDVTNIQHHGKK